MIELYAHTPSPGGTNWHLLVEHLEDVAKMAKQFASQFGAGELAYYLGLWHDIGKASPSFQTYLQDCHANPTKHTRGPDHKAAGTVLAQQYLQPLALLVQGHHGGLRTSTDCTTWLRERQQQDQAVIDAAITELRRRLPAIDPITPGTMDGRGLKYPAAKLTAPPYVTSSLSAEFLLRMLFSALVDADCLDTERHWHPSQSLQRGTSFTLTDLLTHFTHNQQQMTGQRDDMVGQARHTLYEACVNAAIQSPGLFRLAIPTGGGKTRSAMAFALHHAYQHQQHQRIIVAVPFISITEQTAQVYRDIFQADDDDETPIVLEHHSGAATQRDESDQYHPADQWARLASENWDAPIIVTTTVQLFESLFANQTRRCRKLHRLANSIIILDEAQALPYHLLEPILDGLRHLCNNYGTTVVLSTATQPAFESIPAFADLTARDIVPDAARWFTALKRVIYDWRTDTPMTWQEVADQMREVSQVLTVVNTKKDALALLDALGDEDVVVHLSTLLCGAHRRDVIADVKERLRTGQPCHLVSTQVIEAGVDLDFPLVMRAMGPLDRIIQAAGRCNREGRPKPGQVIVFVPAEGGLPPGAYKKATQQTQTLLGRGDLDPDNPDDVNYYFQQLFAIVNLDDENIQGSRTEWKFPEVAQKFRMIDQDTEDVIVRYGNDTEQHRVQQVIDHLKRKLPGTRTMLRRVQPYLVSIPIRVAQRYHKNGLIEPLPDLPGIGVWQGDYDEVRGLVADIDRSLLVF